MSRPEPVTLLDPEKQLGVFAEYYRSKINMRSLARFRAAVDECGLHFSPDELTIMAALDTPAKVQEFLNTQVWYNNDHSSAELEETAMPPRLILQTAQAHCFEGATFAFVVNFLHGHKPKWALLEAYQDSEHNLVIMRDEATGLYGCNAHSRYPHLDGRESEFRTVRALAESYAPWYYSDRTNDPRDITLVGYSEPFDLVAKYGWRWMDSSEPLWDIYYTYVDDSIVFHYLYDDSDATHLYPVIRALKEKWILIGERGSGTVDVGSLPPSAQSLWREYWQVHDPEVRPARGKARELELAFFKITGTTPLDLADNADDLQWLVSAGYRPEVLLQKPK
ncbi:MAG TPA: hypothetical protein VIX58_03755 [Anaerolineae bacterium]